MALLISVSDDLPPIGITQAQFTTLEQLAIFQ
jgi:hypothetical protein